MASLNDDDKYQIKECNMTNKIQSLTAAMLITFAPAIASADSIAVSLSVAFENSDDSNFAGFNQGALLDIALPQSMSVAAALGSNAAANTSAGFTSGLSATSANAGGGDELTMSSIAASFAPQDFYTSEIVFGVTQPFMAVKEGEGYN